MSLRKCSIVVAGVVTMVLGGWSQTGQAAAARTSFNGAWSVLVVTDSGTCDRAYRYALHIHNGRISYPDQTFNVSGHVDPHGRVSVRIGAGQDEASGTGRLSGDQGEGRWSGHSATSQCAGHWEAERRGE